MSMIATGCAGGMLKSRSDAPATGTTDATLCPSEAATWKTIRPPAEMPVAWMRRVSTQSSDSSVRIISAT